MTESRTDLARLRAAIRTVPDYPKPGIQFRDITPLLGDSTVLRLAIEALARPWLDEPIDYVAGIEARGFLFGTAVAARLGCGFVPIRKPGKLPMEAYRQSYDLEYGSDELEAHRDAISPGAKVLLVDDLVATGGSAMATIGLLRQLKAEIVGAQFLIELEGLDGRSRLADEGVRFGAILRYGA